MVPAPALSRLRGKVAERGALKKIAIVEQDAVFCARLGPRRAHERGDAGEAAGLVGASGKVIKGEDVAMHIRRDHHAQAYGRIGGFGLERVWNILSQIQRLHGCTGKGIDRKPPDHVTHNNRTTKVYRFNNRHCNIPVVENVVCWRVISGEAGATSACLLGL